MFEQERGIKGDAERRKEEIINNNDPQRGRRNERGGTKDCESGKLGRKPERNTQKLEKNIRGVEDNVSDINKEEMAIEERSFNMKQKLERIIQLGCVHFLDRFIDDTLNNNIIIEEILAETNQDFATKHIHLLPTVQEAVESKIIQFRLYSSQVQSIYDRAENLSLADVRLCVEMIKENVKKITEYYERDVDSVFLHIATSIARYIRVLKRFLKPTFSLLPWNEIEFCLVIFLSCVLKPHSSDEIYFLILNKTTILTHLLIFSEKLYEVSSTLQKKDITSKGRLSGRIDSVRKIIAEHPEFEKLYNDYDVVKNVYSVNRIHSYVKMAASIDLKEDTEIGKLVIERTLQVLGEYLKNTTDSPNVSDDVHRLLLKSYPRQVMDIIISLRDCLSHADTLTKKIELESEKDSELFMLVQNDLKKVGEDITYILIRKKIDVLNDVRDKIFYCNSLEQINNLLEGFKNSPSPDENYLPFRKTELVKVKEFHAELEMQFERHSVNQDTLVKKIKEIIDKEESKIVQMTATYKRHFHNFSQMFNFPGNIKSLKTRTNYTTEDIEINETNLKEILPLADDYFSKGSFSLHLPVAKVFHSVVCEIDRVRGMDEIKFRLNKNEIKENDNIKKQVFEIFDIIQSKLKTKNDKHEFTKVIRGKVKLHESKKELINYFNTKLASTANEQANDINCLPLFNDLNLEGLKKQDLEKNYNDRNFEKCRLLVKQVDDKLNNLLKSMGEMSAFSVKKIFIALKAFFSSSKVLRPQINKAIDEIEEENKMEVAQFYTKRLNVLSSILENEKYGKGKEFAIEMLILEATEMLEHASLLGDNRLFILENSPVLVGKALRNYLAHGDPLIDIMPFSPRTSILAHARALVAQGGDLITQGRVLGRPSKPVDFLEVRRRNSRREMMAAVQEGMFQAAKKGDLAEIQDWMSKGADPQGRSINGKSALHFAIISDDVDTFQFFLEQGITLDIRQTLVDAVTEGSFNILKYVCDTHSLDLNTKYFKDANLFYCVCKYGKARVLEYLLSRIRDPDPMEKEIVSTLVYAIMAGHKEIVEVLFKHFTYLNDPESYSLFIKLSVCYGQSHMIPIILKLASELNIKIDTETDLLHIAAVFGQETALQVLLASGFSVNGLNENGDTPLFLALLFGWEDAAILLLSHGAEIGTNTRAGRTQLHWAALYCKKNVIKLLLDKGFPVNTLSTEGETALHLAAHFGNLSAVRVLLENGADARVGIYLDEYSSAGNDGITALHLAAWSGSTEVVREIIKKDPETLNARDVILNVPLHYAAREGHVDVVAALVEAGAELNCLNRDSVTPLHVSICMQRRNVSKFLINKGAETGMKTINGESMLMLACNVGCIETVDALIARGVDVNDCNNKGFTSLHFAAIAGCEKIISALLNAGARCDTKDADGDTLLIFAIRCRHNNTKVVEKLLAKCPQAVNVPNGNAETPLDLAISAGECDVVATLLRHGAAVNVSSEKGDGRKPHLYWAVIADRRDLARILLDNGADVNINYEGVRLIRWAMEFGLEDMAILLVERGAYVNVPINEPGETPFTSLGKALDLGFFRLSRALLRCGADIWDVFNGVSALHIAIRKVDCDVDVIHFIVDQEEERLRSSSQGDGSTQVRQENMALVNARDTDGLTPLHLCCIYGRANVFIALLDRGADPALVDNDGRTLLHMAASNGHAEIIHIMIDREVYNICLNANDKEGRSPLQYACLNGHTEVATALLEIGADANIKDISDFTPFHMAAYFGHTDIIRMLMDKQRVGSLDIADKDGRPPLHLACAHGHTEVVRILLDKGALLDSQDNNGATPLHAAAHEGQSDIVRLLLQKEVYNTCLNAKDNKGRSPLHYACLNGHIEVVTALLEIGADANIKDISDFTPFHMAAYNGNTDIILLLMDKQVRNTSMNAQDMKGRTPLHFACIHGHTDVVTALLHKGVDLTIRDDHGQTPFLIAANSGYAELILLFTEREHVGSLNIADKDGRSPLHLASAKGYTEVVRILLDKGALTRDDNLMTPLHSAALKGHADIVRLLLHKEVHNTSINAQDIHGRTPLHYACGGGHTDVIVFLLEKSADSTVRDEHGRTPFLIAANNGFADLILLFTERELVGPLNTADKDGRSPLHLACSLGHTEVVRILLDKGTLLDSRDNERMTPLHFAARKGHADIVRLLLHIEVHNSSINAQDMEGSTPLHFACSEGHTDVVATLLENGADSTVRDEHGRTPFLIAANSGYAELVLLFTEREVYNTCLNAKDNEGRSPLHCVCLNGHTEVVTVLLEIGADTNIKDNDNLTPLHMAAYMGHTDIIRLLMEKQVDPDPRNGRNWTPIFFAAQNGHPGVIHLLAAYGASVNATNTDGVTPLLVAVKGEIASEVRSATAEALLAVGADPNLPSSNGITPLLEAVMIEDVSLVCVLLKGGADIKHFDIHGWTRF